jgi:hypothetical protein
MPVREPMAVDNERRKRRRAWWTGVGVALTVAWILFWVFAVWGDFKASAIVQRHATLTLIEWGVFLAAVVAPIAFLWFSAPCHLLLVGL